MSIYSVDVNRTILTYSEVKLAAFLRSLFPIDESLHSGSVSKFLHAFHCSRFILRSFLAFIIEISPHL